VGLTHPNSISLSDKVSNLNSELILKSQKILFEGKQIDVPVKLLWENTKYFAKEKINITPVSIATEKMILPGYKYWVTELDENGNVIKGNYYIVLTKKDNILKFEDAIMKPDVFSGAIMPKGFTGSIIKHNFKGEAIATRHYDNGVLTDKKDQIVVKKSKNQPITVESKVTAEQGCSDIALDWYWLTWEDGVVVSADYMYTTHSFVCTNYGGNNGGVPTTPTCVQLAQNFLNLGAATSGFVTAVDTYYDPIRWEKTYNWIIYTAGTWGLISYEKAIFHRVTYPNMARWEFESMTHTRITHTGINVGGTRSYIDLGATTNFTSTRTSAWVRIDFSVTSTPGGCLVPITSTYNANNTFYAPNTVAPVPS
jgi:hypothetical protein